MAIVALGVGTSIALRSRGHDTISTCGRRVLVGRSVALYLGLHVAFDLGRWDPLGVVDRFVFGDHPPLLTLAPSTMCPCGTAGGEL